MHDSQLEDKITAGSIETTDLQKRQYARESMEANKRDPMFCKIFPDLIKGTTYHPDRTAMSTTTTTMMMSCCSPRH
jgi:hypothetical protein